MSTTRDELAEFLDNLLNPAAFADYGPNGLQIEGAEVIERVAFAVSATRHSATLAAEWQAQALVVHHGLFWKGEDGRVTGFRRQRLRTLLANDINLFAYHLPLDVHPVLGNNAQLAQRMAWQGEGRFADQELGWIGRPARLGQSAQSIADALAQTLGRTPLLVGDGQRAVQRAAWCTGGAQGYFEQAILAGADLYVSGEISEQTVHLARESGVPFIAAGHHATERYGAQAVAAYLVDALGLEAEFIDLDNPV